MVLVDAKRTVTLSIATPSETLAVDSARGRKCMADEAIASQQCVGNDMSFAALLPHGVPQDTRVSTCICRRRKSHPSAHRYQPCVSWEDQTKCLVYNPQRLLNTFNPPPYKPRNHTDLQIESTAAEMLAHDLSLVATASLAHSYTAIVLRTEHAPISGLQYGRARKSVETCPAVGVPKKRKRASPTLCQQPAAPA